MKIYLSPEQKVRNIKKIFQRSFPYLKLEFFRKKHRPGEISINKEIVPDSEMLIEVSGVMREGEIEIRPGQTIAEIEQLFQQRFNLPVQIFRKTKFSWLETSHSDQFTLEKLNRMGKEASGGLFDRVILL